MSEKETKVTKQETLAALRNPGELYRQRQRCRL